MTAWETYVEDRVVEAAATRLLTVSDPSLAAFVKSRLMEEIKRLHNPSAEKTIQLFTDYAGTDVSICWKWNHVEPLLAKQRLNYLKLRGDVVHRSRTVPKGAQPQPHPVTKEDLQKAIAFLKELVKATDRALCGLTG